MCIGSKDLIELQTGHYIEFKAVEIILAFLVDCFLIRHIYLEFENSRFSDLQTCLQAFYSIIC